MFPLIYLYEECHVYYLCILYMPCLLACCHLFFVLEKTHFIILTDAAPVIAGHSVPISTLTLIRTIRIDAVMLTASIVWAALIIIYRKEDGYSALKQTEKCSPPHAGLAIVLEYVMSIYYSTCHIKLQVQWHSILTANVTFTNKHGYLSCMFVLSIPSTAG